MCDASDFAIGAVLSQREDGKPYVIYYASKTLNEAQRNYTTTEKELLAVVFRNCESDFWHTCATSHHSKTNFAAAKRIAKWLRKWHFAAKLKLTLSLPLFLFIPVI